MWDAGVLRQAASLKAVAELLSPSNALRSIRDRPQNPLRILIISASIKQPTALSFSHPAPLLKEKRYSLFPALPTNRYHPLPLHRTRPGTALPANNHPGNPRQVNLPKIFQQWLDG